MALNIVILAAGEGKRMYSRKPKVLHELAGKPLLQHVIDTAKQLKPKKIHIIYGHHGDIVRQAIHDEQLHWIMQDKQLGTGHAVLQAMPFIDSDDQVLVLSGDVPLISKATLETLIESSVPGQLTLLTAIATDPTGLGRIIRECQNKTSQNKSRDTENNKVTGIVEQRDANTEQLQITEIYTGIMLAPASFLQRNLPILGNANAQGEYYLTELIAHALHENLTIQDCAAANEMEVFGINNRKQLADCERYYQQQFANQLMLQGVTLADPLRFDCRGELQVGTDVFIDINVVIEGKVSLGNNVYIEPNVYLRDVSIDDDVIIHANSVIEQSVIAKQCQIGPFARLRPGTQLAAGAKIGNYVEVKKSIIGEHSKVNHLSYIGDATIGNNVNVGAGTITCNYDGANKHSTIIEDNVFIGSGTQLVAPIKIGAGATIGAGTTLRKNAPEDQLTLSRSEQMSIKGWKKPVKQTNKME